MEIGFFLKGVVAGLIITAPIGPVGVICINRTLSKGLWAGFCAGLGAVTADTFYGAVAVYGLTAISSFLTTYQFWLRLFGGLFLVYLGFMILKAKPILTKEDQKNNTQSNMLSEYFSTLTVTLANPMIIAAFAFIFAGLGLGNVSDKPIFSAMTVGGVILGSMLGWLILSIVADNIREKAGDTILALINKCLGVMIIIFSILTLASIFIKLGVGNS